MPEEKLAKKAFGRHNVFAAYLDAAKDSEFFFNNPEQYFGICCVKNDHEQCSAYRTTLLLFTLWLCS